MPLLELRVSNLALLRNVRVPMGAGLTALTGETGSGKSLCITALRLALGARVEGDLIRAGADSCGVAAVFDDVPGPVRARLEAHGIPDDELLTLSRELSRSGRGAARVNGALVSVSTLRDIAEELVEVTAQGEGARLLRSSRQRTLLDAYGGAALAGARTATGNAVLAWRDSQAATARAREGAAASAADLAEARALVADLEPLRLRVGEDDELAAECRRLRHAAALGAAMEAVRAACTGGDEAGGAADTLAAALAAGHGLGGLDPAVDAVLAGSAAALERLRDLGAEARDAAESIEVDAARLAAVEERLDALERVRRRHGGSVEAALEALAAARERVAFADSGSGSIAALEAACEVRRGQAAVAAAELSRLRAAAAARLERAVTERLRELRLPRARFRVVLTRTADPLGVDVDGELVACTTEGVDAAEFRFSAAADGVPIPLHEGVSGGELSRVALAVRSVVAMADDCATVVLDEVDTGIGGETAARVGETLAAIGEHRQVLVVTHRAEIAARADEHVLVSRHEAPGGAEAAASVLTGEERPAEIARLMSGRVTDAAVARAVELLAEGRRAAAGGGARTMAPR